MDRCQSCQSASTVPGSKRMPDRLRHIRRATCYSPTVPTHPTNSAVRVVMKARGSPSTRSTGPWRGPVVGASAVARRHGEASCTACHQMCRFAEDAPLQAERQRSLRAGRLHRLPFGERLRRHSQDRTLPETDRRQGRSRLAGPLDRQPARVRPAHAHAELHAQARPGGGDRRVSGRTPRAQRRVDGGIRRSAASRRSVARKGKELVETGRLPRLPRLPPGEFAGAARRNKDIAPNLRTSRREDDGRWIYHWIKNPRGYSDVAHAEPAPDRRRSAAITDLPADLGTQAARPTALGRCRSRTTSSAARSSCASTAARAATTSRAWRRSRASASSCRPSASKTEEELFFGDRTDIRQTWDDWTYNKLKAPAHLRDRTDRAADAAVQSRRRGHQAAGCSCAAPRAQSRARYQADTGCAPAARRRPSGDGALQLRRLPRHRKRGGSARSTIRTTRPWRRRLQWRRRQGAIRVVLQFPAISYTVRPWLEMRMPTFGLSDEERDPTGQK